MSRFNDDLHLVAPQEYEPTMVSVLLRRAGLADAPRTQQLRAISDWLRSHRPSPLMEESIHADGFSEAHANTPKIG